MICFQRQLGQCVSLRSEGKGLELACEIAAEDEFLRGNDGFGSCGLCYCEF